MFTTTQRSFISEWGVGSPNLQQIGYQPEGDIVYNVGWNDGQKANSTLPGTTKDINAKTRPSGWRGPTANDTKDVNSHYFCRAGTSATGTACGLVPGASVAQSADIAATDSTKVYNKALNQVTF